MKVQNIKYTRCIHTQKQRRLLHTISTFNINLNHFISTVIDLKFYLKVNLIIFTTSSFIGHKLN